MKVVITGANGSLGSALMAACSARHPAWTAAGVIRKDADLSRPLDVVSPILSENPDVVIHCAAMTGVDKCETEPELAWAVNVEGTRAVVSAAEAAGARIVYISTDYVFDGKGGAPYPVGAAPRPLNVYGRTKLEGELLALAAKDALVVRTSWLYGRAGKSFPDVVLNLCRTQKEIRMVDDQRSSPTNAKDLAGAVLTLVDKKAAGTYHVCNSGSATWYEFARAVMELKRITGVTLTPVASKDRETEATRPADSRLDCSLYSKFAGAPLRDWREALAEHLA